jgi:hypothetical protein
VVMRVAVPDGLAGLAAIGAFAALAPRERRLAVLAGTAGAAFPDLDKPSRVFFGRSPFPRARDDFHRAMNLRRRRSSPPAPWPCSASAAGVMRAGITWFRC